MNEHYEHICSSNITNSIHYDLSKRPFSYLKPMIYMNTYLENMNVSISIVSIVQKLIKGEKHKYKQH